jgi:hypothetical protein
MQSSGTMKKTYTNSDEQKTFRAGRKLEHRVRGGLRGKIASLLFSWREGRRVTGICQKLLLLYREVSADHPELNGRELYRQLIMTRNKCDSASANEVLKHAEESFASWPVPRQLSLCDVVHYLTVCELVGSPEGDHRVHSNIEHLVVSCISKNLP